MIIVDLDKTFLFNIGISVFSCIITLIIFFTVKRDFADSYDNRLLCKMGLGILLVLLADMWMWILNGKSGDIIRILSYLNIIFYFIMQIIIVFWWLRYSYYRLFGQRMCKEKEFFHVLIPFALLSLIVLSSPLNGWCFYLDDRNYYHRGILSAFMSVIILLYLLLVTVVALVEGRKEMLIDRKKELYTIAFFAIPPFIGGLLQMVFYGLSMLWPCVVVSSFMILLNKESQAISQDALTGLNNRRNMDKILKLYEEGNKRLVTLIMMDINDFKHINDEYGHNFGDMALIQAASILRSTVNGTSAFLARYGGDEFIIILPEGEETAVKEIVGRIKDNFNTFSRTRQLPFHFSVSVGYAISREKSDNWVENLFKAADESMYQDKALHHEENSWQSSQVRSGKTRRKKEELNMEEGL